MDEIIINEENYAFEIAGQNVDISQLIYVIRGKQVMIDSDLALLYQVETKNINKAMKRNIKRFPEDFCFLLTSEEEENLRFQFGTSSDDNTHGGRRYPHYAYTEQGIAMLSAVLRSDVAINVSIRIMKTFVEMRKYIAHKDNVSFVLVFMLSRFGRNAADVLNSLQIMQDFGVNLICVEDNIDSSKEAGKLMISVLSAVAEIERENIRVQTMEGRMQKAKEGRWNGGFPPYGYSLVDGELIIYEEEAVAVRTIFDQYVNTDMGSNGIAKYLENHGIHKITRQNGTNPLFDASLIRRIIQNPVYAGKIAYGRRRTEKVYGTRNDYHQVYKDDYLLVDGLHEALVSEEVWELAQVKVIAQAKKYEKVNSPKGERIHLLSGILKCPICGAGMYGNKSIKHKKDGTRYSDYFYYGCKHRNMTRGPKCDYRKQMSEEKLDRAVAEVLRKLVSNKKFAGMMREKIGMEVDTTTLDQEIASYEKTLRQCYSNKDAILSDLDNIDYDDKHYQRRKSDLENRLSKVYDKIEETEDALVEAKAKKRSILAEKVSGDNIYKALIFFKKTNDKMNDAERRDFFSQIIEKVEIHEEEQQNGQWLKSITFKLPIIPHDMEMSLDKGDHVETVVLLEHVSLNN